MTRYHPLAACVLSMLHYFSNHAAVVCVSCCDSKRSGFGYRAKYIVDSAKLMHSKGGEDWTLDMRTKERDEVRAQLVTLCGVGPKVRRATSVRCYDSNTAAILYVTCMSLTLVLAFVDRWEGLRAKFASPALDCR